MRECQKCKESKPVSEFNANWGRKDCLQTMCKVCQAARSRQYYAENREKHIKAVRKNKKEYQQRNQQLVVDYLRAHECVDCSEEDILVLEFDHQGDKEDNISSMIHAPASVERLQAEIEKCEVVCANCHRRRTAKSQNHFKYLAGLPIGA